MYSTREHVCMCPGRCVCVKASQATGQPCTILRGSIRPRVRGYEINVSLDYRLLESGPVYFET